LHSEYNVAIGSEFGQEFVGVGTGVGGGVGVGAGVAGSYWTVILDNPQDSSFAS